MKLLEYKGKELLKSVGISVPSGILVDNKNYSHLSYYKDEYRKFLTTHNQVVIKAQVLGGGRKKVGLIIEADDYDKSLPEIDRLYSLRYHKALIDTLLIEEKLVVEKEFFASILYDTKTRRPMIMFSVAGGIDIEENTNGVFTAHPAEVGELTLNEATALIKQSNLSSELAEELADFLVKLYRCFINYDCSHCEVNPIIKTSSGLVAADAKVTVDDGAIVRHQALREISDTEEKTRFSELELEARRIDQEDHRGVAGKTFVEMDGDIAVLASGGGASLTAMDALIEAGGAPANYTEYSGNPSKEKVKKLTKVTLSKTGLNGCLVIGGTANFTDIFETLSGFIEGLQELSDLPKYPIIIRRAGPRDKEAFAMLKDFGQKSGLDLTLFGEETPISYAAKIAAEKVDLYKKSL